MTIPLGPGVPQQAGESKTRLISLQKNCGFTSISNSNTREFSILPFMTNRLPEWIQEIDKRMCEGVAKTKNV